MNKVEWVDKILQPKSIDLFLKFLLVLILLLNLPSLGIWLGLPPEGDAVDYRIPMVKWMVEHREIPNWSWAVVDDFPALGEMILAILYWIHPNLMRLLPILAYFGIGYLGAKILLYSLSSEITKTVSAKTIILIGIVWILGLRPMAIQSNLLMLDNLASFFILGSLWNILNKRIILAGIFCALSLSTRYFAWPIAFALFCALWVLLKSQNEKRLFRQLILFTLISAMGAIPFMVRNTILNDNPFFPLLYSIFNGPSSNMAFHDAYLNYGRGKDLLSFALLPFDFLYTNSFVRGFYDYTLGKLFYAQIFLVILALILARKKFHFAENKKLLPLIVFFLVHLVLWFLGAQQMRFLVPGLVVINAAMLVFVLHRLDWKLVSLVAGLSMFSVLSIQKDSILMFLGKRESIFLADATQLKNCLKLLPPNVVIGLDERMGAIGLVEGIKFRFIGSHPHGSPDNSDSILELNYLYSKRKYEGFSPLQNVMKCHWQKRTKEI